MQIQISWLLQDLHCLQRWGTSWFHRTRVNMVFPQWAEWKWTSSFSAEQYLSWLEQEFEHVKFRAQIMYDITYSIVIIIWATSSEKVPSNMHKICRLWSSWACTKYQPGPSCSKLTTSLVNDLHRVICKYAEIFCWKNVQKLLAFFQQKISEYCILNPLKQLMKWPLTSLLS